MTTLPQAVRDAIEALKTPTPREIIAERLERALDAGLSPSCPDIADVLAEMSACSLQGYHDPHICGAIREAEEEIRRLRAAAQAKPDCGAKEYVDRAIASFVADPADNRFLKGYLAALEAVRNEAFSTECPVCERQP